MDKTTEQILQRRMHGLYLSRKCDDLVGLSHDLLGLHCWFHRNVAFSAILRGANLANWKRSLIKTWIHHALHGVAPDDLPTLLALNPGEWRWGEPYQEIADKVIRLMEDGIYSRAEMRLILAEEYDRKTLETALSPWGGVFCELARLGKVAFRDMASRDFDLIDAEPTQTFEEILPELFRRFLSAYGPATLADATWFFGFRKERKKQLYALNLDEYAQFQYNNQAYYDIDQPHVDMGDIPELTLLSGFDPLIVSFMDRSSVLPPEYRKAVITKSGICLPTIAVNGKVAGLWNIKNREPVVEFFTPQPKRIIAAANDLVENMRCQTAGIL